MSVFLTDFDKASSKIELSLLLGLFEIYFEVFGDITAAIAKFYFFTS
jgi:hypothetical protein